MPNEKPATTGVPRSEADVANSGPAPWSNRFFLVLGPIVKIVFLEKGGGEDEPVFFRAAATMAVQDAIALKNTLTTMLAEPERQLNAAVPHEQSKPPTDA